MSLSSGTTIGPYAISSVLPPMQLFQGPYYVSPTGSPRAQYDVTADGRRFLMLAPSGADAPFARRRIVVVEHSTEALKHPTPTGRD